MNDHQISKEDFVP